MRPSTTPQTQVKMMVSIDSLVKIPTKNTISMKNCSFGVKNLIDLGLYFDKPSKQCKNKHRRTKAQGPLSNYKEEKEEKVDDETPLSPKPISTYPALSMEEFQDQVFVRMDDQDTKFSRMEAILGRIEHHLFDKDS
ncbi:TOM1-like protein 1-like protein [Corchorus olitorius]|uniref:TOM1-like protein 1-like protein n=1 Tax=Corchorus olitorius TaxID=93759 RepID=A0A1R3L4A4_9ROSI|nr:TOM1-like protein 1-like protein [Corchorus olitorius]